MNKNKTHERLARNFDLSSIKKLFGENRSLFEAALVELPVCFWIQDENCTIVYGNHAFEEKFGTWANQKCYQFLMGQANTCHCCRLREIVKNAEVAHCQLCKRLNNGYDINVVHVPIIKQDGHMIILKSNLHYKY